MLEIEVSALDLSHETLRLKDPAREKFVLASIAEAGIREPLWGVCRESETIPGERSYVLLDGFKRYRCARKLGFTTVPWHNLAEDEAQGLLALLSTSNARALHILEQARLVDCLHRRFSIGVCEIARRLERSPAWVSVRLGMLKEMGAEIREAVFSGKFPARSYLYMVRHFTRVKGATREETDRFVKAVSGQKLSGRQVDALAEGYFQGAPALRAQIEEGKLGFALEAMKQAKAGQNSSDPGLLSNLERGLIRDLEIVAGASLRVIRRHDHSSLNAPAFFAQAEILVGGITRDRATFEQSLEKLHVRCREKKNDFSPAREGGAQKADRPTPHDRSEDRPLHH